MLVPQDERAPNLGFANLDVRNLGRLALRDGGLLALEVEVQPEAGEAEQRARFQREGLLRGGFLVGWGRGREGEERTPRADLVRAAEDVSGPEEGVL